MGRGSGKRESHPSRAAIPYFCKEAVFPKAHSKLDLLGQEGLIEYACFSSFLVIILGEGMVYRDKHQV